MTNHQKGYRRDRLVLDTIAEWGTMDTEQLRIMFYPSLQVARRRLRTMLARGKLKRTREATEQSYIYFIKHNDRQRLALNWARIWLIKKLKSWEVLESFDYATGSATISNTVANTTKAYIILYNATRRSWIGDNAIIVYDTDEQRREASKRIKGTLLSIDDIREGLKCSGQQRLIHS